MMGFIVEFWVSNLYLLALDTAKLDISYQSRGNLVTFFDTL